MILDADNSLEGSLAVTKVAEAIRMLGAQFFADVTGNKRQTKNKLYDNQTILATEEDLGESEATGEPDHAFAMHDDSEETFIDAMNDEGGPGPDAVLVADIESAAQEVLQQDPDLATAFSSYTAQGGGWARSFATEGYQVDPRARSRGKEKPSPRPSRVHVQGMWAERSLAG